MDAQWITSPAARRILAYWADPRPAWVWSHDGSTLIWRNTAARYFTSRIKKDGPRPGPEPRPIKGQVSRLIRLGSIGRASLSRVQFLAAGKPLATTCACTPLTLADGQTALLIAAIDPVDPEILAQAGTPAADSLTESLLPPDMDYRLVSNGEVVGVLLRGPADEASIPDTAISVPADAKGTTLVLFPANREQPSPAATMASPAPEPEAAADLADLEEPMLPLGISPLPEAEPPTPTTDDWVEPLPQSANEGGLTALFDRLAEDAGLYTSLSDADEIFAGTLAGQEPETEVPAPPEAPAAPSPSGPPPGPDLIAAVIEYADDPESPIEPEPSAGSPGLWMITGRGFRALRPNPPDAMSAEPEPPDDAPPPSPAPVDAPTAGVTTVDAAPDPETAERVSRYNFEELGRILTDRVAGDGAAPPAVPAAGPRSSPPAVVSLSAETLVLNRLPLAIVVFRDQQVLFANRALTDLLGHESVESLRAAGIASIFPAEGGASAGPVNRLIRRDGTPLGVTARLQSVSWQGRAALMLSASPAEPERGHEAAVRAFAEIAAETQDEGFFLASRAGTLTRVSARAAALLGRDEAELAGKPLAVLVRRADMEPLRTFLEKPARFAETARPTLLTASEDDTCQIAVFAEGQAGLVTGYFGFVHAAIRSPEAKPVPTTDGDDTEPSILGRLSRSIRRPLNTIIGFADLIRSTGLGAANAERYVEYARDIRTAGLEIAVLVDELDDFTRLRDGQYPALPGDIDLIALLEASVLRVKAQAGAARVLVRSAFAEALPHIRADRASLSQALLNLMASAIDQTPIGGSVIVSAQRQDEGGVAIHVRDGANSVGDPGERFVVFRDGIDKDGQQLEPVRSSVGLALTRSLLAVNACSLAIDPTSGTGTLFSLLIPAELVAAS